jgi:type IV secretory pathway TraG/TraD family ATPase VirD4
MAGSGGATSFEERIAELAVSLLAALFAAAVLLWAAGELAGLLSHGHWPPIGIGDAPSVAAGVLGHPADPAAGWPASARRVAPPAWLYYCLLGVLVLAMMAGGVAFAVHVVGRSPDQRAAGRVPPGLGTWPSTRRRPRPFLAWTGVGPFARLLLASSEDGVAVVGPPRVGKTQSVLVPQMLLWDGPAVSGSTWPDVMEATAKNRRSLAAGHGGRVMRWAPTATPSPTDVESVGWSPLSGCELVDTCERRVRALVTASGAGIGARHADHWRDNAIRLLRGYFHAAALEHLGVRGVLRWLARNELREPSIILTRTATVVTESWADELEGMTRVPAEELGSIFSAARTALGALQNGRVRESCDSPSQFDADELLLTNSTLYLVSPTADQDLLAPLAAALVEHVVQRAYDLREQGRLPARLLLCLDELANTAPLPSLLKILTQGGGRGVNLTWSVQSLAQMRDRYGEQVANAAFSSSRARLVFGGLTDTPDLQAISQLAGEHEVPARSLTRGAQMGQTSMTAATVWRPRLPVSAIRGIPAGRAVLLYHTSDPALVRVRLAFRTRLWRRAARATRRGSSGPGRLRRLAATVRSLWRKRRDG